jgi:hypothetical protein
MNDQQITLQIAPSYLQARPSPPFPSLLSPSVENTYIMRFAGFVPPRL